jgi:hypothetical protein
MVLVQLGLVVPVRAVVGVRMNVLVVAMERPADRLVRSLSHGHSL